MRHIETLKSLIESLEKRRVFSPVSTTYVIEVLKTILAEYEAETSKAEPEYPSDLPDIEPGEPILL